MTVSVKAKRYIKTAFFYIDDGRLQKTMRKPIDSSSLIAKANSILTPQTNIIFVCESAIHLKIKKDLGKAVVFNKDSNNGVVKKGHEWDDLKKFAFKGVDMNVFFVKEFEAKTPHIPDALAGAVGKDKMCIIEDIPDLNHSAIVLAHEAGHVVGNIVDMTGGLMGSGFKDTDIWLTPGSIDKFNPSGARESLRD